MEESGSIEQMFYNPNGKYLKIVLIVLTEKMEFIFLICS